jgi:hypothetical protein
VLALVAAPVVFLVGACELVVAHWRAARRPPPRVAPPPDELDMAAIFARPPATTDQAAARSFARFLHIARSAPRQ